jgi:hypothetical protein
VWVRYRGAVNPFGRLWRWLGLKLLIRRIPMVGEVKNRVFVHGADFDHSAFGSSRAFPTVLEIVVDDDRDRRPAGVGKLVKQAFFPDEPRFLFNVCFSCGDPGLCGPGLYGDPRSIWFNVFFGYYEIDAPCSGWQRPFGYRSADPAAGVELRDVVRLGKADWNYFSNRVYGVPLDAIRPHDAIDLATIGGGYQGRVRIGESWWDRVVLEGVEVVSSYVAPGEEGRLERADEDFTPFWRLAFGRPCPRPEARTSFVPLKMRAELYLSCRRATDPADVTGPVWRTLIFGGTVRADWPDRTAADAFLALQLDAVRKVMARDYARDGFRDAAPS